MHLSAMEKLCAVQETEYLEKSGQQVRVKQVFVAEWRAPPKCV